jgi:HEPN domain-containing protein
METIADQIPVDVWINDFAFRCFFEIADADYIAARLAFRAGLNTQFLWASHQAAEKYLKYILLRHRIRANDVLHDLEKAVSRIHASGKLKLDLTESSTDFLKRLNQQGPYRYLEVSNYTFRLDIIALDRTVWELRRYCKMDMESAGLRLEEGVVAPRVWIDGGFLETVIEDNGHTAREALLWQNGYFGRRRRRVRLGGHFFRAHNSPLFHHPEILDEVLKFVYVPRGVAEAYRELTKQKSLA